MHFRKFFAFVVAVVLVAVLGIGIAIEQKPAYAQGGVDDSAALPSPVCVFGWSKDTCNGGLEGVADRYACRRDSFECRTVELRNAVFKFPVNQSSGSCGDFAEVPCDEVPRLDGTIVLEGDFTFGYGRCRFRGAWCGKWRLVDLSGTTVAAGTGQGTLGTGSHRAIGPCLLPFGYTCNPNCERCYDVSSRVVGNQVIWNVGLEGTLKGNVFDGAWASSTINIALSGTLNSRGTDAGPNFEQWFYCGASDGVVLAKCQN